MEGIDETQLHKMHQVVIKPTSTPLLKKTSWEEDIIFEAQQFRLFIAGRTSVAPEHLPRRQLEQMMFEFQQLLRDHHLDRPDGHLPDDLSIDDIERLGDENYDSDHDWTG
jgi:hypothetical protein